MKKKFRDSSIGIFFTVMGIIILMIPMGLCYLMCLPIQRIADKTGKETVDDYEIIVDDPLEPDPFNDDV